MRSGLVHLGQRGILERNFEQARWLFYFRHGPVLYLDSYRLRTMLKAKNTPQI